MKDILFPPPPNVKTIAQIVTITPWNITKGTGTSFLLTFLNTGGKIPFCAATYIALDGPTIHALTSAKTPRPINAAIILTIQSK